MRQIFLGVGQMQQWLRNTEPAELLNQLSYCGADFIEMIVMKKELESQLQWMNMAWERNLKTSFHAPYFAEYELAGFEPKEGNAVREAHYHLFSKIAEFCEEKGYRGRVNLHCATSSSMPYADLMALSVDYFSWLSQERVRNGWNLEYVIELLPVNTAKKLKIGQKTSDLIKLREKLGSVLEGFCWDLGHYQWNIHKYGNSDVSSSFFRNVRHVHIHDFKEMTFGMDHCPLNFGLVPWERYLTKLPKKGDIYLVLELDYRNTQICGEAISECLNSFKKIKNYNLKIKN